MNEDHQFDGTDPDQPRPTKRVGWQDARRLCDDLGELRKMSESDKRCYSGAPRSMYKNVH